MGAELVIFIALVVLFILIYYVLSMDKKIELANKKIDTLCTVFDSIVNIEDDDNEGRRKPVKDLLDEILEEE